MICTKCNEYFPSSKTINGKVRSFSHRKQCLACQPIGTSPYAKRYTLEERAEKLKTNHNKKRKNWRARIIAETGLDPIREFRFKRKEQMIIILGGECQICGYNKCQRNLSFHHIKDKSFPLDERRFQYSVDKLISEIIKCVLICSNCHGEVHAGLIDSTKIMNANQSIIDILSKPIILPNKYMRSHKL